MNRAFRLGIQKGTNFAILRMSSHLFPRGEISLDIEKSAKMSKNGYRMDSCAYSSISFA